MKLAISIIITAVMVALFVDAMDHPIVFKVRGTEEICGCIIEDGMATKCDLVPEEHEVIWVSKC